jgi:hypothetical protein
MKKEKIYTEGRIGMIILITLFLYSCGTTVNFPVSDNLPAADVKAKVKKDKNNIYEVEVKADHLADPDRLSPEKKHYVVWIMDVDGENHSIGQLKPDRSKEAELFTMTPYTPVQLFITAENKKDPAWPSTQIVFRSEAFDVK